MKLPIIAVAGLLAFCSPADAQTICAPYEALRETLNKQGVYLEGGNGQLEIWVDQNDDWVIIVIDSQGIACLVASGENWTKPEKL